MKRGKKFKKSNKETQSRPKKKAKFNYRESSYIKDRKAKNDEIEKRRQLLEEAKIKEQKSNSYDEASSEEELNPLQSLLKTFDGSVPKVQVLSDSEDQIDDDDSDDIDGDESEDIEDGGSEDIEYDSDQESDNIKGEDNIGNESVGSEFESGSDEPEDKSESEEAANLDVNEDAFEIEVNDVNEEDEETNLEDAGHVKDPFTLHLRYDLDPELYNALTEVPVSLKSTKFKWPTMGNLIFQVPKLEENKETTKPNPKKLKVSILGERRFAKYGKVPKLIDNVCWSDLYVKPLIQNNLHNANKKSIMNQEPLTSLQKELFSVINNYQDLLYMERNFNNEEEIRFMYCLHTINHILKTRTKVLHHNAKIQKAKLKDMSDIPDEYRDQGLVRPKVLILVPFRNSCLKIVETLTSIFIGNDRGGSVINKSRFMEDFGGSEVVMPKKNPKPEDYELLFKGNIDDSFKIGISITKKALKLYSEFYSSDIIISSVLGLRMLIGAEGEAERDYDFLASIEVLILDQLDVFFMQNWDHLLHILDHIHLQPRNSHGTDFSRIRSWCVNGWSKYYRQTLLFSSIQLPEIHNIFNKRCFNYAGKVKVANPITAGSISQVIVQIPQVFHKFIVNEYSQAIDMRFEFFKSQILPQFRDSIMNHTLIFIPSYFDYVKIRNYLRNEEFSFVQICEYSKNSKIARARDMFFHSDAHFLLYTERFHFFRRIRVKGIRHIIFYAPPTNSHFYSEMCNLMQECHQNPKAGSPSNMTVTVLYCKYDILTLSAIVGSERASKMINSEKTIHMLMTGD